MKSSLMVNVSKLRNGLIRGSSLTTLIIGSLLLSLVIMLSTGCGGDSGSSQASTTDSPKTNAVELKDGKEIQAVVLPRNVVAKVDGKEITSTDLDAGMIADGTYQAAHIGEIDSYTGEVITGTSYSLQPGSPEYARRASIVVGQLVLDEIARTEAQKMGLSVSEADIDAYYVNARQGNGDNMALNRDQVKKLLLVDKVWQEITKNAPLDADGAGETAKQEAYDKWILDQRSQRVVTYANSYLPSTRQLPTNTTTAATQ